MKTYDQRSGGCGCGGGGGCAGGCGATHGTTPANGVRDGFVRPRFFAGQLLTEDDLQALVDYQVGKRRLTNRMLFGAGVTAGLQVWCDPCNPRQVRVLPGHAIDGFGNDLYLDCPQTVDVVTLARAISGDGCAPGTESPGRLVPATYALRLHYTETAEDPIVPHIVDDGCATSAPLPEATRIREGVRFSLSCNPGDCGENPPPDPRAVRLAALVPDIATLKQVRDDTDAVVAAFNAADYEGVSDALSRALHNGGFGDWLKLANPSPVPRYPTEPLSEEERDLLALVPNIGEPDEMDRLAATLIQHLSTWYAIWIASRTPGRAPDLDSVDEAARNAIYDRLVTLGQAARRWSASEDTWAEPVSYLDGARRAFHEALAELARHFVETLRVHIDLDPVAPLDPATQQDNVKLFLQSLLETSYFEGDEGTFEVNAVVALHDLHLAKSETLIHWREYLARAVDRFTCRGQAVPLTHCDGFAGLSAIGSIPLPRVRPTDAVILQLRDATTALNSAITALLADAICEAHLTPMPSLTPSGVLLARVTLGDCRVLRICVLGRPQIDGPYARRTTDPTTVRREHADCRQCCHPPSPNDGPSLLDAAISVQQSRSTIDDPRTVADFTSGAGATTGSFSSGTAGRFPVRRVAAITATIGPINTAPADDPPMAARVAAPASPMQPPTPAPARPNWNPKMRKAELTAIAESAGLAVSESDTKATIVAALEAHDRKE